MLGLYACLRLFVLICLRWFCWFVLVDYCLRVALTLEFSIDVGVWC